jgi:hypothetical protein
MRQKVCVPYRLLLAIFTFAIALPLPASAGAPGGHPDSVEGWLQAEVIDAIDHYSTRRDSEFARVVKVFLWDNRMYINSSGIGESHMVDAVICVLSKKYGYSGFRDYTGNNVFLAWCDDIFRQS